MNTPQVSVVIPTHNRPALLRRALDSVFAQTFGDYEVIVVDDGDRPRAQEVIAQYANRENLVYLETKKNEGGPVARNMGIAHARGEYVAFLDDDDEWEPEKLALQMAVFRDAVQTVGFVFSAVRNVYPDRDEVTNVDASVRDYSVITLTRFKGFLTSGLVVKRAALAAVGGFDPQLPSHQEADLLIRLAQQYEGIGLAAPLVRMRMSRSDDHIGGNIHRRIAGREMVLHKHRALMARYPHILGKHYFWLALLYRDAGRYSDMLTAYRRSFMVSPRIRTVVHGINGCIVAGGMTLKHFILGRVLRPAHIGLMMRLMYARKYMPAFVFSQKGVMVLDAGCGRGRYSEFLASTNPHASILAVDISQEKEWETYPYRNVTFKVQDLHTYDEHEVRDFVMSIDVLEHIPQNDLVLARLVHGLKKGGYLYLAVPCDATTPHFFPQKWFAAFHEWEAKEHIGEQRLLAEWAAMLTKLGMQIELSRYTFTIWGTLAWEIQFLLHQRVWGRRCNVVLMPLYRLLAYADIYLPLGKGNNLIVARKPL